MARLQTKIADRQGPIRHSVIRDANQEKVAGHASENCIAQSLQLETQLVG
jgi:hypothetical protein